MLDAGNWRACEAIRNAKSSGRRAVAEPYRRAIIPWVNSPTARHRAACVRCLRPLAACLCALAQPTAHRTEVLVLQHPQEQRHAKNSAALLRLSLANCEVVVGERFSDGVLQALLHRPGRQTRLLYPDAPTEPALSSPVAPAALTLRLVVIDATWRKSLRMLLEHPALAALPRLSLDAPAPTRYRAIRAARRGDQVSTLEATVQALAMLEGPGFDAAPLLDAFGCFVASVAARQPPHASSRQALPAGSSHPSEITAADHTLHA
jgi:DTW domain-containing protein